MPGEGGGGETVVGAGGAKRESNRRALEFVKMIVDDGPCEQADDGGECLRCNRYKQAREILGP